MRKLFLVGVCFALWALAPAHAQSPSEKKLTATLQAILDSAGFPGFAVAITHKDQTVYSQGFGYANKTAKTRYTPQTIQPIGSVSKTVIGLAVMKAAEMKLCTLDTDINVYLPFKIVNPHRPDAVVTLRHLATHTSGFVDHEPTYLATYQLTTKANTELGAFLEDYYRLGGAHYRKDNFADSAPGERYAYSNIASALAAYIVERVTKTPFDLFTERELLSPLAMRDSHWQHNSALAPRYATLYEVNDQEHPLYKQLLNADKSLKPYSSTTYPDGSLRSSVDDLARYIITMDAGAAGKASVVSAASFEQLFRKQFDRTTMPAKMDTREPNRALFWAYARNDGLRHTGSDPGVFAFVSLHPKTRIGRAFTMNTQIDGDNNEKSVKAFAAIIAALNAFEESLP